MLRIKINGNLIDLEEGLETKKIINYPILILPDKLGEIFNSSPSVPIKPSEPKQPSPFTKPEPPEKPTLNLVFDLTKSTFSILLFPAFLYFIQVAIHLLNKESGYDLFKIDFFELILIAIGELYIIYLIFDTIKNDKIEYRQKTEDYKVQMKEYSENIEGYYTAYQNKIDNYKNKILPQYLSDLAAYEVEKKRVLSIDNLAKFRKNQIDNFFHIRRSRHSKIHYT